MQKLKAVSNHYLSERGYQYFNFFSGQEFGRAIQAEYFLPYTANDKVLLDFGCADGLFLRHLPAEERIGIEVNPAAKEKCEELSKTTNIAVELHEALRTVENERVDIAVSNHALEHVLNPYETLVEMHRVLKPNGHLVFVVPFDDWRSKGHSAYNKDDHDNHLYTWSPLNLGNIVTEAGFTILKTKLFTRAWSPKIFWVHRLLGRNIFDTFVKSPKNIIFPISDSMISMCYSDENFKIRLFTNESYLIWHAFFYHF